MTASILTFRPRLVDANLVEVNRTARVTAMAAVLIEAAAYANERDAIMALMWSGKFSSIEIAMLIPDAMQLAQQEAVVAREMGAP
jgi:hypothetical protein